MEKLKRIDSGYPVAEKFPLVKNLVVAFTTLSTLVFQLLRHGNLAD
jgi:hypothetical protein